MRTPLGAIVLVLVFVQVTAGPGRARSPVLSLDSAEFKVLLKPDRFTDRKAVEEAWKLLRKTAKRCDLDVDDGSTSEDSVRHVLFLDTAGFDLFRRGFVLRRRQETPFDLRRSGVGHELTFKYRNQDAETAQQQDVRPSGDFQPELKFEKDVIGGGAAPRAVYSLSGTATVNAESEATVGGYSRVFPGLASLGLPEGDPISCVNDIRIEEHTVKPGSIVFSKHVEAKVTFSLWYRRGRVAPLIVEVSYKIKKKSDEAALPGESMTKAETLLRAFQSAAGDWIAVGQTKTGIVYGQDGGNHD